VITLHSNNFSVPAIHERFKEEKVSVSLRALYNLVQKHDETGIIVDLPQRRKERKMSEKMVQFIEQELRKDDELTSTGIRALLLEKWPDLCVSIPTVKRVRKEMGWVCTRPHYCQLLRDVSHLAYSKSFLHKQCVIVHYWTHENACTLNFTSRTRAFVY